MKKQELLDTILELPANVRAELANALLESLNPIEPDIQDAWVEEVRRRMQSVKEGNSKFIPGEEVMKKAGDIINRPD